MEQGAVIDARSNEGTTPLHSAAGNSNIKVLEYLVSQDAKVDAETDDGMTPMLYAVGFGKLENIECLVHLGVDINKKQKWFYSHKFCHSARSNRSSAVAA